MEFPVLDPFGDYATRGYLRNVYGLADLELVGHLETAVFQQRVLGAVRSLRRAGELRYAHIRETHRQLFESLYPWAGDDRSVTAPEIAIAKAGYKTLFAHPLACELAAEHALKLGRNAACLRDHPGEVFGYLAHAHPFLEGNGRTILTVFAELTRRAKFHIAWEELDKQIFLKTLTEELLNPGRGIMDALVLPYVRRGMLSERVTARRLEVRFHPPR